MRAFADPDAFLPTDLGVRHALERLGQRAAPSDATALAERWRPWRGYAVQHLWASLPSRPRRSPALPRLAAAARASADLAA